MRIVNAASQYESETVLSGEPRAIDKLFRTKQWPSKYVRNDRQANEDESGTSLQMIKSRLLRLHQDEDD